MHMARLLLASLVAGRAGATSYVQWQSVVTTGTAPTTAPSGRASMAFAPQAPTAPASDMMWMLGGVDAVSPLSYSEELWSLTARGAVWTKSTVTTNRPAAMVGAGMCAVGHHLHVFGGKTLAAEATALFYRYDTSAETWNPYNALGSGPGSRSYHAMECVGTKIFVHGGQDASASGLADLHVLDQSSYAWESSPAPSGSLPTARTKQRVTSEKLKTPSSCR